MDIKIMKLNYHSVIPTYSKEGDAGVDLTAVTMEETDKYISYDTKLSFEIPHGFVGLLFPRSSLTNYDLTLGNHVGVLDSSFRGSVTFRFKRTKGADSKIYNIGDRVGQLIIIPYPIINFVESTELSTTERNTGGYGSSGN